MVAVGETGRSAVGENFVGLYGYVGWWNALAWVVADINTHKVYIRSV